MNDTELLTLAAKAAGMEPPFDALGGLRAWVGSPEGGHWWSPLEDDGDALRLAAKLQLDVLQDTSFVSIKQWCAVDAEARDLAYERVDEDRLEVTRRAIVIAAAEIGRAMP